MAKEKQKNDNTMARKVAMGATGVAVVSSVVAGAAILANKGTRQDLAKGMNSMGKKLQEGATEGYQTVYHQLNKEDGSQMGQAGKGRKRNRKAQPAKKASK